MKDPLSTISPRRTPQSEPIPGTVPNSAGGHAFALSPFKRLERFLILGTEGGTFYIDERKLTLENVKVIDECLALDPILTITTIEAVSVEGRAPRANQAIFALAKAASHDDPAVRTAALARLNSVCRTGTHLFLFVGYIEQFRGWGPALRRAVANWYTSKEPRDLAYQLTKYRQREGWSHRDVLRLCKPKPERGSEIDQLIAYAVGKGEGNEYTRLVEHAQHGRLTVEETRQAIYAAGIPWETIDSKLLADPVVWTALAERMPMGALIRNLGRMGANGALKPLSDVEMVVTTRLANEDAIRKARVHPLAVLMAEAVWRRGQGVRGKLSWTPTSTVSAALDKAFYKAFANVEPTGKRIMLCLDVSGSMGWGTIAGSFLTPAEGSTAMALVTASVEPRHHIMAFASELTPLNIHAGMSLPQAMTATKAMTFGGTDCAAPMIYARRHGIDVDAFVVYTDSETWAGRSHPVQELAAYRRERVADAKLIVVGMTSNGFSIADPRDPGMLDVVGYDSMTPALIAGFIR